MKNIDLRIGNKLQKDNGEIFTVLRVDNTNDVLVEEQRGLLTLEYNLFGIPLTEEWLLKLGFEKEDGYIKVGFYKPLLTYKRYLCWAWNKDNIGIENDESDEVISYIPCKYVHQLQNLYFTLTGEELIIK